MATSQKVVLLRLTVSVIVNRWAASSKTSRNCGQIDFLTKYIFLIIIQVYFETRHCLLC